jgi:hypothetical protein
LNPSGKGATGNNALIAHNRRLSAVGFLPKANGRRPTTNNAARFDGSCLKEPDKAGGHEDRGDEPPKSDNRAL